MWVRVTVRDVGIMNPGQEEERVLKFTGDGGMVVPLLSVLLSYFFLFYISFHFFGLFKDICL